VVALRLDPAMLAIEYSVRIHRPQRVII